MGDSPSPVVTVIGQEPTMVHPSQGRPPVQGYPQPWPGPPSQAAEPPPGMYPPGMSRPGAPPPPRERRKAWRVVMGVIALCLGKLAVLAGGGLIAHHAVDKGVAAMRPDGRRADFSQVHSYTTIAAPGVDIYSASNTGGYQLVDGTSPAYALAAGTVALMMSRAPGLSPRQVRRVLVETAVKPARGYTVFLGRGLINARAAVQAAARAAPDRAAAAPYCPTISVHGGRSTC
ncbi:S8 family serine peptidase [Microbispora catharanthi]|uniref:S8 family serine peptidase n=1 Tax=Microbispora catharanthi TaxID=1712871 RepID=A0A5N6B6N2_9ACTN|nr:S8 family serine peptidase [Microbispora catharanthi]KAB8175708.1 S8 family serine peptidase [Microbispora catharanthi]